MRRCYFTIAAVILFSCGWFFAPWILFYNMEDCISKSIIIYDEPDRYVISRSTWFTYRGGQEHRYSAQVSIDGPQGKIDEFSSERTIETERHFNYDSINVNTVKSFRIAGPLTSDPRTGKYIDPPAKEGFTGQIHLFRYKNSCLLAGFKGGPLSICQ
ncbi:hypothetical protein BN439_0589 [Erwinia amylovora Ea644]|uniref:hypothetical protein n=1 Tax=Erwinia amylovora TaxID=552 RepID=UPI0002C94AAF|nr:hypothetical protein [Erwinia amylovora]CCP01678.1 hypothetical protein BN439_0589 [Erwinia amylovora Ea644]CCP05673.1 hypothetical protein BN440_0622 [Erwinia amylovora MR1]